MPRYTDEEKVEMFLDVINSLRRKNPALHDPTRDLTQAQFDVKYRVRKRKPSAYSKRYGTAYRKLKRQHPRMSFGSLSKKAHKLARKK